ncbi:MAG: hypothetical protein KGI37_08145 [Alphaproteobacteria bacterium]|nr:hypothetical protein [Alphaproteobacteria bacterium]
MVNNPRTFGTRFSASLRGLLVSLSLLVPAKALAGTTHQAAPTNPIVTTTPVKAEPLAPPAGVSNTPETMSTLTAMQATANTVPLKDVLLVETIATMGVNAQVPTWSSHVDMKNMPMSLSEDVVQAQIDMLREANDSTTQRPHPAKPHAASPAAKTPHAAAAKVAPPTAHAPNAAPAPSPAAAASAQATPTAPSAGNTGLWASAFNWAKTNWPVPAGLALAAAMALGFANRKNIANAVKGRAKSPAIDPHAALLQEIADGLDKNKYAAEIDGTKAVIVDKETGAPVIRLKEAVDDALGYRAIEASIERGLDQKLGKEKAADAAKLFAAINTRLAMAANPDDAIKPPAPTASESAPAMDGDGTATRERLEQRHAAMMGLLLDIKDEDGNPLYGAAKNDKGHDVVTDARGAALATVHQGRYQLHNTVIADNKIVNEAALRHMILAAARQHGGKITVRNVSPELANDIAAVMDRMHKDGAFIDAKGEAMPAMSCTFYKHDGAAIKGVEFKNTAPQDQNILPPAAAPKILAAPATLPEDAAHTAMAEIPTKNAPAPTLATAPSQPLAYQQPPIAGWTNGIYALPVDDVKVTYKAFQRRLDTLTLPGPAAAQPPAATNAAAASPDPQRETGLVANRHNRIGAPLTKEELQGGAPVGPAVKHGDTDIPINVTPDPAESLVPRNRGAEKPAAGVARRRPFAPA